jgi:vitamin B12 transporter
MTLCRSALLALLLSPATALAQQPPGGERDSVPLVHVTPIVVTATRAPAQTRQVASSITVVTRDEIDRRQYRTVLDILRDVPGTAIVRNGGPGGVTSAFLRGAGNDHALVLIDGVAVNDASAPTEAYDFAHLLAADVERVEILRGPQSTLYGSSALGGVVQIFTRRAAGSTRAAATLEGGSLATTHAALSVTGGERVIYALTVVDHRTDGISASPAELGNRERDAHRVLQGSTRLEWRATPTLAAGFVLRASDASADIDQGTPTGDDPNYVSDARQLSGRAWSRVELVGGRWRQTLALEMARDDRESRDAIDSVRPVDSLRARNDGRRRTIEWTHEIDLGGRLQAGVEREIEKASGSLVTNSAFGPFVSEFPEERARMTGIFLQHEWELGPLSGAVGARTDHHDRFGSATTFRLAPLLLLGNTRLKASYGTGFKAPTLFQLFDPQFGNRDLDPETSRGWDFGIERDLAAGRALVGATVFATDFEDLIAFSAEGYRNVRAASSRGLEVFVSLLAAEGLRLRSSYTYSDAEDESEGPDHGRALIRRPRHQGGLVLDLVVPGRGDAAVEIVIVGEREDEDFSSFPSSRVALDRYALVRIAGSHFVVDGVRVFARIENALDAEYQEVFGFGAPGRALYAGVEATF